VHAVVDYNRDVPTLDGKEGHPEKNNADAAKVVHTNASLSRNLGEERLRLL
jgi:hypothetical protein